MNCLQNKSQPTEHLKKQQITSAPFADYRVDIHLFPQDNFCILAELKSQQRPITYLSIIYGGGNEGGEWTHVRTS